MLAHVCHNRADAKRAFPKRTATTYLEVQVAMVMLMIGVSGLYSLSVVQSRQTVRLTRLMDETQDQILNASASTWAQKLGVYASMDTELTARPAVMPRVQSNTILDDASTVQVTRSNLYGGSEWIINSSPDTYGGLFHKCGSWNPGSWFQFQITGLAPGRYEIFTSFPPWPASGTAVPHDVYDSAVLLDTILVNQTLRQTDLNHDSQMWARLGVFNIDSGEVVVRIRNDNIVGSFMRADAVLVREASTMKVVSIQATEEGGYTAVLEDTP